MWPSRRKLAIFAAISECLIYADAKYCAFEIHGEPKYYVCPRTEYCCNFGCCVSPGFQIYHLWYYWLLVIIMFLVCSGGGWWYRYWLQGRYRPSASTIPPRTSSSRAQNTLRGPTCRAQQARVTYNPARNTVLLHRMWKGPQRNATPPAYNNSAAASSAQFQNTNVVLNDNNCPYYELYGPPPSYETVIAQTRGKIMSPTVLEHARSNAQIPSMQNPTVAHRFSHNNYSSLPTRIHIDADVGERRNSCGSNLEPENYQNSGYKNFGQSRDACQVLRFGGNMPPENCYQELSTASGTRSNLLLKKLPFCVPDNGSLPTDSGGMLQNSKSNPDTFTIISTASSAVYSSSAACASSHLFTQNVTISPGIDDNQSIQSSAVKTAGKELKLNETDVKIMETEQPTDDNHTRLDAKVSRIPKMFTYLKSDVSIDDIKPKYHRMQNSSLKARPGSSQWAELKNKYCDVHRYKESSTKDKRMAERCVKIGLDETSAGTSRSTKYNFNFDCEECIAQSEGTTNSEQNPSNNVILPAPNPNVEINSLPPINIIENYQHYPPSTSPAQRSTSTNFESENKLARSKSLD